MSYKKKKNKNWPKSYIKDVFKNNRKDTRDKYTSILLENLDLINMKNEYFPENLFKFYAPTADNILDIKNKKLWLAHPDSFNDPFDCKIAYDSLEFEKQMMSEHIINNYCVEESEHLGGFTRDEIARLSKTTTSWERYWFGSTYSTSTIEYYPYVFSHMLRKKDNKVKNELNNYIKEIKKDLENKIAKIKELNIRVACFCDLNNEKEFIYKNQMWAHYADDHKGFCVEYDISSLKKQLEFSYDYYHQYENEEDFLEERRIAVLKGGLFPLIYTSNRLSIPFSRLKKLQLKNDLKIYEDNYYDEFLYKTYITKSTVWSYEREWRIILDNNICKYYDNKISFPYIKKIYLGCRMDKKNIHILNDIAEELEIEIVQMKEGGNKFYLDKDSFSYNWEKEFKKYKNPYL